MREDSVGARLRLAQYNDKDLEGIWTLCKRSFPAYGQCCLRDFHDLWRHRWLDNPARRADHVFGWILENRQDGIVGYIGILPIRMKVGSREVVGGAPHTWAVSREYAAFGFNLYKQAMAWGEQHLLVATTAAKVTSIFNDKLKFGLNKLPVVDFDRRFLWAIRPGVPVMWMLENASGSAWSSKVVRSALGRWLIGLGASVRFMGHQRLRCPGAMLPVEPVKSFTDEYTQFWEHHNSQYGITTVRDRRFLQWRHIERPAVGGSTRVFACRDKGRLKGYVAMQERQRHAGYFPGHFRVTDIFFDRERPEVFYSLMNHAFEFAKSSGCSLFEVSHVNEEVSEMLKPLRPHVMRTESWPYWYKVPAGDLDEICQGERWWPSGIDGDANL